MAALKGRGKRIGLGVAAATAAAAAAAAGYYFYASKDAKKHRRIAAKWASNLKRDIVTQAKKVPNIDRKQLLAIIDGAASAYETARDIDPRQIARASRELRDNWQELLQEVQRSGSKKKSTKRTRTRSKAKKSKRATR